MNKKALQELLKLIEDGVIEEETFDMTDYCSSIYQEFAPKVNKKLQKQPPCGTTFCLVGQAALHGAGELKLKVEDLEDERGRVVYKRYSRRVFQLSGDKWEYLFGMHWGKYAETNNLDHAAERIRSVLKLETEADFSFSYSDYLKSGESRVEIWADLIIKKERKK